MNEQNNFLNTELGQKLLVLTRAGFTVSNQINDLIMRDKVKSGILGIYESFTLGKRHTEILKEIEALDNLLHLSGHLGVAQEGHMKKLRNGYLVFKSRLILADEPFEVSGTSPMIMPANAKNNHNNWLKLEIKQWKENYEKVKGYPIEQHYDCFSVLDEAKEILEKIEGLFENHLSAEIPDSVNPHGKPVILANKESAPVRTKISERHGKIMSFIQGNGGKAQLADLMNLFPKLSEKSIRNDLAQLCADSKLKRIGWGPTSHYTSQ